MTLNPITLGSLSGTVKGLHLMAFTHGRFHPRRQAGARNTRSLGLIADALRGLRAHCGVARWWRLPVLLLALASPVTAAAESSAAPDGPSNTAPAPTLTAPAPSPAASSTAPGAPGSRTALQAPPNLNDIAAWLEYRAHNHIAALPQESRVFYRRGLQVHQSGSGEEAIRLVRGATELDPEFVAPHLTLAAWFLLREPSQALLQYAAVLDMVRQSFVVQLAMVANALYLALQALFLGLVSAALLVVWIRNAELRHIWAEQLGRFISPGSARAWAWSFLLLPFALGLGIALPTATLLGLLWPTLRLRERALFVALVAMLGTAPWTTAAIDRLSVPLRPEQLPLFGIPALASEPYSQERQQQLQALAAAHPDNPFAQFGLGWEARRGGDLHTAEAAYRRAFELWPGNDRVMNNLGNTLAMQGRTEEAVALFKRATTANALNAAAYFNASQIYTQRFDYRGATEALSRASAINFDLVKSYQSQATDDGLLPLVDQWLAPRTFWEALSLEARSATGRGVLPPAWRTRLECSGWMFSALAALLSLAAAVLGTLQHRGMPLRTCSNCGGVVCRRCAQRRRETALCAACAAAEARAETPEFARVFLGQRHRRSLRRHNLLRTALSTLIPGYGWLATGRVFAPLMLLTFSAALASPWIGLGAPFSYEPRLSLATREIPIPILIGCWIAIYALSLVGYFKQARRHRAREAEQKAPVRSRNLSPTDRRADAAAA